MNPNEENVIEQIQLGNCRYQWTNETTKLLIDEVRNHIMLLNNKNYLQKKVWKRIANKFTERGYNVTEDQCCIKWKNLKRKYLSVRDLNNQTGEATQTWEYFDIIDDFINPKPEVAPVSIASSTHGFRIRQSPSPTEQIGESDENNSAAVNTSCDIRRNIRKRRQNNEPKWVTAFCKQREAHHAENMKIKKKMLTLFEKYLGKDNAQ